MCILDKTEIRGVTQASKVHEPRQVFSSRVVLGLDYNSTLPHKTERSFFSSSHTHILSVGSYLSELPSI